MVHALIPVASMTYALTAYDLMAHALMAHALMAHALMARPRTCDGKNPEPSLTTPAPTARSTRTTFPDEPTFKSSSTRAASTSTTKREEKEKSPGTAITGRMAGRSWMTGKSWMAGRAEEGSTPT